MKLLSFTDTHGSQKALKLISALCKKHNPEVMVCCGDISIFEKNLAGALKFLASLGKPVIMVNGNHEGERSMAKLCRRFPNIHFVHGAHFIHDNILFLGYGGDGFSIVDPLFTKITAPFKKIIKDNNDKKIVLVTHAPPYGTKLDHVHGGHSGNKSIRNFIEAYQPCLLLCGHIHENSGKQDRIRKTAVVNPGPFGKIVEI